MSIPKKTKIKLPLRRPMKASARSFAKPQLRPTVELVANVEDQAFNKAFNLYRFRKVGGTQATCLVERSKVSDVRALGQILLDANADLPSDPGIRAQLLAELIKASPAKLEARAAKVGWVDRQNVFVRHGAVTGDVNASRKLLPPMWVQGASHRCQVAGDTKAWLKEIGPVIRRSSRIQLLCSAVYAAPLLRLMNLQPFAVVVYAESSVGKSSAVLVAGSLLGLGTKDAIPNWNLTAAALHETACRFNDHAFLIDETAAANLPKEGLYDLLRRVTYTYAEGVDARRHSKSGYATSREQADAKGIMITTSEHSLDALAALAGKARDGGEIARAFNVPALHEGSAIIFDLLPDDLVGKEREDWIADAFAKIRSGAASNHGGAFRRYIEHLVKVGRTDLVAKCKQVMQEFERELALQSHVGAIRHAAKNFSLIYAGGIIAIEAGLLPVKKERLLKSIVRCFRDGLVGLEPPKDMEAAAVKQLLAEIEAADLPEKSSLSSDNDPVGFRRRWKEDDRRVMLAVKPATFDKWFSDKAHRQAALCWLHQQKLLLLKDGETARPTGIIPPEAFVTFEKRNVADGRRENGRWIRFLDPRNPMG